jgi:hypothetical protein
VLFEIADGERHVACAISPDALRDLTGERRFRPAELLRCFAAAHARIESIALGKLRARRESVPGVLNIWSDDIEEPPPADAPEPEVARRRGTRRS